VSAEALVAVSSREASVTKALVSLSSSLDSGHDVVDLLAELVLGCVRLLDVASASLLLADAGCELQVVAASSSHSRYLSAFELGCDEGPSVDCFANGTPTLVPDIDLDELMWPRFTAGARLTGFASVHALPMRFKGSVLGVLGLYGTTRGRLNLDDLSLGQALADIASVALVHERTSAAKTDLTEQLQTALESRMIIDQAKGVLMAHGADNWLHSFHALRRYSRDRNLRVSVVARSIISGDIDADVIVGKAPSDQPT
jgi:GAF domain-containing protein